jgi:hypothetical protein
MKPMAAARQILLPALPRHGAKDTGERDSLQRLTAMGSRVSKSPRRPLSFQLGLRIPLLSLSNFPGGPRTLTVYLVRI